MEALSQATLIELARAGAVRGDTLHDRSDGNVLSVQYGLHKAVLTAKRGGARRFSPGSTPPSPCCGPCARPRSRCVWPTPRRPHAPTTAVAPPAWPALDRLHAEAAPPTPAAPRSPQP